MINQNLVPTTETATANNSLQPTTFMELQKFAQFLAKSDLVPRDYKNKPENVLVAGLMGHELGLQIMQAIQNISVINGRPCLWGDALLALVKQQKSCEYVVESVDEKNMVATCKVKRAKEPECIRTFSMQDAAKAGLVNKDNWKHYPKRMIQLRARAFALRDSYPDVLKGLNVAEEVQDYDKPQPKRDYKVINSKNEYAEEPNSIFVPEATTPVPQVESITKEQLEELKELLQLHDIDVPALYKYYKVTSLLDLDKDKFEHAIKNIKKKPLKAIVQVESEEIVEPENKPSAKEEALNIINNIQEEIKSKKDKGGE